MPNRNIRSASLGAALALTVGLAAAGPATWPLTAQTAIQTPECAQGAKPLQSSEVLNTAAVDEMDALAQDELIEEYLSFHAQVVEEGGKLSLVPGSRLRTHAN